MRHMVPMRASRDTQRTGARVTLPARILAEPLDAVETLTVRGRK